MNLVQAAKTYFENELQRSHLMVESNDLPQPPPAEGQTKFHPSARVIPEPLIKTVEDEEVNKIFTFIQRAVWEHAYTNYIYLLDKGVPEETARVLLSGRMSLYYPLDETTSKESL